jgi:hypothetical protein
VRGRAATVLAGCALPALLSAAQATAGGADRVDVNAAQTWSKPQTFASGLVAAATNPAIGNDPNDRRLADFHCTTDSTTSNPGFTDENCLQISLTALNGQNSYGHGTNAKKTFLPLSIAGNMTAAGQRFLLGETQTCWGMGDCFGESKSITFAGADIAGDEGQGFQSVSYLQQQPNLVRTTIAERPVRSACNTALTQAITATREAQTVAAASTAGCKVDDWVVVGEETPTNTPNHEAVKISAVAARSITGTFLNNHGNGTSLTPALVLALADTSQFGQGRVLVDLKGVSYSAGTVSSISGGGFAGSGTSWSANMVGGGGYNIGCISLTADDYASAPFQGNNGPLKSWYQIVGVASVTSLGVYSTSVAGDAAYHGHGPGSGGYIIRPCAEVLRVSGRRVILETSTANWANGDTVELTISPYPDVSGHEEVFAVYTPGGAIRRAYYISNRGARTFQNAIEITANMPTGHDVDPIAWRTAISIANAGLGISIDGSSTNGAMQISTSSPSFANTSINFSAHASGSYGPSIGNLGGTPSGARLLLEGFGSSGAAALGDAGSLGFVASTYPNYWASYTGLWGLGAITANNTATRLRFYDRASTGGDPQTATSYIDLRYAYPNAGGYHGLAVTGSDSDGTILKLDFGNRQTTLTGALTVGTPIGGMPGAGAINAQAVQVNGAALSVVLSGSTSRIGGSSLPAGSCTSGGATIAHATTAMAVVATPQTYPGDGFYWTGFVATDGLVTVKLCAIATGTPVAITYNIRVLQ